MDCWTIIDHVDVAADGDGTTVRITESKEFSQGSQLMDNKFLQEFVGRIMKKLMG